MAPMTFLVTAAVTGKEGDTSASSVIKRTYREHGIKGFYPGGSAIALRQVRGGGALCFFLVFFCARQKTRYFF